MFDYKYLFLEEQITEKEQTLLYKEFAITNGQNVELKQLMLSFNILTQNLIWDFCVKLFDNSYITDVDNFDVINSFTKNELFFYLNMLDNQYINKKEFENSFLDLLFNARHYNKNFLFNREEILSLSKRIDKISSSTLYKGTFLSALIFNSKNNNILSFDDLCYFYQKSEPLYLKRISDNDYVKKFLLQYDSLEEKKLLDKHIENNNARNNNFFKI